MCVCAIGKQKQRQWNWCKVPIHRHRTSGLEYTRKTQFRKIYFFLLRCWKIVKIEEERECPSSYYIHRMVFVYIYMCNWNHDICWTACVIVAHLYLKHKIQCLWLVTKQTNYWNHTNNIITSKNWKKLWINGFFHAQPKIERYFQWHRNLMSFVTCFSSKIFEKKRNIEKGTKHLCDLWVCFT